MNNVKYPSSTSKNPKKKSLGCWAIYQRQAHKNGQLSPRQIRELEGTPGWSWTPVDERVLKIKAKLLEMALKEKPRPDWKNSLGKALRRYTDRNSGCYDAKFDKKIKKLAPQWFANTANENKTKLLEMARNGEPRPSCKKTNLGAALCSYTCSGASAYDAKFNKKIRKLIPRWFVNTADEKRTKLLKMAHKGEPRPNIKTELGKALICYTNKSNDTYNTKFDKKIRELAPRWFVNTADEKKAQLLQMALNKKLKPHYKTKLGQALVSYINKSHGCYDAKFDKQIRKLAPQWFKK